MQIIHYLLFTALFVVVMSCSGRREDAGEQAGKAPVRLMTLAPGHFHAALVQKDMYPQVDSTVWIYAPEGPELNDHMSRIRRFNERDQTPTSWNQQVFVGDDFLERMLAERPGNVAVISGNNARKTDYIHRTVSAGIHVLADKPMAIDPEGFELLRQAFEVAAEQKVLLYDIMTERYEITSILQKELSRFPEVFGTLLNGSPEEPAVVKESVHHFYKQVSGAPLVRPAWFFDVRQQGEGVVDVTTHLVDLIQWACFPEEIIDYTTDIELIAARRWATDLTPAQFARVTQLDAYPDFLKSDIARDSILQVYSNGEIRYKLRGVHALVSVTWAYEAPPGAGDTHYSIMRGSRSNLVIRQGAEQAYRPTLYIEPANGVTTADLDPAMQEAMTRLSAAYPGLGLENLQNGWKVLIPESYKVGHEAHFAEVTERFLQYLEEGSLPAWEVPNMLAKYYTTTRAFALSR
jgi:predicted dehydrogenase